VDPSFATRFKREAEYADALDHSHILELYDAGEASDGTLFFAMQYVSGADLEGAAGARRPAGLAAGVVDPGSRSPTRWIARTRRG
jgi:serine/threonine protein kinase